MNQSDQCFHGHHTDCPPPCECACHAKAALPLQINTLLRAVTIATDHHYSCDAVVAIREEIARLHTLLES